MAAKDREHLIRDRKRTEAALIAAARSLAMDRPYESIRVREIAEVVGCNHGLITHYFGSKLGLFTQVLHQLGRDLTESIGTFATPRELLSHPLTGTYWRLMATLLEAGLDPDSALSEGPPVVDAILRRGEELVGRNLEADRGAAAFIVLAVGGFQVFGQAFASRIMPSGDPEEAVDAFGRMMQLIVRGLSAE
ncbi:MAG: TetR/AcrR family transcriptional regulator [Ilumatobacteraceae bacterium]|jgi:AcrR family transcriptional regulator